MILMPDIDIFSSSSPLIISSLHIFAIDASQIELLSLPAASRDAADAFTLPPFRYAIIIISPFLSCHRFAMTAQPSLMLSLLSRGARRRCARRRASVAMCAPARACDALPPRTARRRRREQRAVANARLLMQDAQQR